MLFRLNKITTVAKIVIKVRSPSKTTRKEIRKPTIIEEITKILYLLIIGIGLPV